MTDLRQTAEEILEMTGRVPLHPDPTVEQQILIQDIADIIEKRLCEHKDFLWELWAH